MVYLWSIMTDELFFIKEIRVILKDAFEVNDWNGIQSLICEINDFLGEGNDDDDDDLDMFGD